MAVLFTLSWDVIQGKEDDYTQFVVDTWLPAMEAMGLMAVGGYYVEVGSGPRIIAVHCANDFDGLCGIVSNNEFKQLVLRMKSHVYNYRTAVLEPTGRVRHCAYVIQKGVWKFNQYYDLRPGRKRAYADFVMKEYIPALEKLDYLEVTGGWNVVLGGVNEVIGELTFKDPVDIGRMLNNEEFRRANQRLQEEFVVSYQNRILRCTERFDEPKWFRL